MTVRKDDYDTISRMPESAFKQMPLDEVYRAAGNWDNKINGVVVRLYNPETGRVVESYFPNKKAGWTTYKQALEAGLDVAAYDKNIMHSNLFVPSLFGLEDDDEELSEDDES